MPGLLGALALTGAAGAEDAVPVGVGPGVCRALVPHVPAPDVAFRPGVDARGKAVAPADLPAETLALPETFVIEIGVDLFRRLGIPPEGGANYRGRAVVGTVELAPDGALTFNGRPLPGEGAQAVARECGRSATPKP